MPPRSSRATGTPLRDSLRPTLNAKTGPALCSELRSPERPAQSPTTAFALHLVAALLPFLGNPQDITSKAQGTSSSPHVAGLKLTFRGQQCCFLSMATILSLFSGGRECLAGSARRATGSKRQAAGPAGSAPGFPDLHASHTSCPRSQCGHLINVWSSQVMQSGTFTPKQFLLCVKYKDLNFKVRNRSSCVLYLLLDLSPIYSKSRLALRPPLIWSLTEQPDSTSQTPFRPALASESPLSPPSFRVYHLELES